jgi:hypothetical protein
VLSVRQRGGHLGYRLFDIPLADPVAACVLALPDLSEYDWRDRGLVPVQAQY